jgi:hypothetical protein
VALSKQARIFHAWSVLARRRALLDVRDREYQTVRRWCFLVP